MKHSVEHTAFFSPFFFFSTSVLLICVGRELWTCESHEYSPPSPAVPVSIIISGFLYAFLHSSS